jgi:hypothetical protein
MIMVSKIMLLNLGEKERLFLSESLNLKQAKKHSLLFTKNEPFPIIPNVSISDNSVCFLYLLGLCSK